MLHHREEGVEHLVRRLESFSDIVIGFSLAELTLNLAIPGHFADLTRSWWWLIGYLWTFAVVSLLWFSHHRLFVEAFVPSKSAIVLNFVWLATVGLLVYLLQVFGRFASDEHDVRVIYTAYFALYAFNIAITAALYALGVLRTDVLDERSRTVALKRAVVFGGAALIVFAAVAFGWFLPFAIFVWVVPWSIAYGFGFANILRRTWGAARRSATA